MVSPNIMLALRWAIVAHWATCYLFFSCKEWYVLITGNQENDDGMSKKKEPEKMMLFFEMNIG